MVSLTKNDHLQAGLRQFMERRHPELDTRNLGELEK